MTSSMKKHRPPEQQQKLDEAVVPIGNYKLKFENKDFGPEFEEKAKNELRESPEIMQDAIIAFRKLVTAEPNFEYPVSDEDLLIYLRPCKFYVDSAMAKMRKFYKFKEKHPKYYDNLVPSFERAAFLQSLPTILPHRTPKGERVLIVEAGGKWQTKTCSLVNLVRSVILILEAALAEPRTQVAGAHAVLDMEGLSMSHVWQFTPTVAKDIVELVQDCIPIRLKGIHVVNQPYVFNMVYAIFKPFLGEKLRNRIHFYGTNFGPFHEAIGRSILPKKYDGELDLPMDQGDKLLSYLCMFEDEFKQKNQQGYFTSTNGK